MSNIALGLYKYVDGVNDTPFPSSANQAFLVDWQYGAKRMGGTPVITGGTINHPTCLDSIWDDSIYVMYNGEHYFPRHAPTSSYSSTDSVYKHQVDFVSERFILDNIYFYDVIPQELEDESSKPISNNAKFTFFGTLKEFVARLNVALNQRGNTNYTCVIDDTEAEPVNAEKRIKFDNKFISEAMQESFKVWGVPYYFVGRVIHYGDYNPSELDNVVFEYGMDKSLLSITKTNANTRVVNRITGLGSKDNIPYYYPNSCEEGVVGVDNIESSTITAIDVIDDNLFAKKIPRGDTLTYSENARFAIDIPSFYAGDESYGNGQKIEVARALENLSLNIPFEVPFNDVSDFTIKIDVDEQWYARHSNIPIITPTPSGNMTYEQQGNTFLIHLEAISKGEYQLKIAFNISTSQYIAFDISADGETHAWKSYTTESVFQNLTDIGLRLQGTASNGDNFQQIISRVISPQSNLMPPIYRESGGDERFYNAVNNSYINPETGEYYEFPCPYTIDSKAKEYIHTFDDIKPSIKGVANSEGESIDRVIKFAFDENDSDEMDEQGNYLHPYFFALLPKMDGAFGFNLFDQAIDEDEMSLSFTQGNLGACEFKIGVGQETNKNIVQIEIDNTTKQPIYDEDGHPILVRNDNGDVKRSGTPQSWQNDTFNNEVWVALRKDDTTYGIIMPNATSNYKPNDDDDNTFVILHINLPIAYIRAAENALKEALISYMWESNKEHWNFSINFSRIYLQNNPTILQRLNENAKLSIRYNGKVYDRYVSSYTYKTSANEILPAISVELAETLSVSSNPIDNAISGVRDEIGIINSQRVDYSTIARLARGALPKDNVNNAGDKNRPIYFKESVAEEITGIDVPDDIHSDSNIHADGGVAAKGISDLSIGAGGGGTATSVIFDSNEEYQEVQPYIARSGVIHLPSYPSITGLARQSWVSQNFAVKGTENRVSAIEALIPSQAGTDNQLADKDFVNSSVTTATAEFQGTYDVVNDLGLTASATHAQIQSALLSAVASRQPDNNDYVFVSIPAVSSASGKYERYKFNGTSWAYEYTLNNSSFTAAQWASINSGITSDKVTSYDTHIGRTDNPHNVTKSQVGLGNVENTKLSTWVGSGYITTLGTIATGVWHGTAIADTYIASAGTWNAKQDALAFDGTYDASTNKVATKSTVTNAINALDVSNISGFGAGKTLASLTETDGKIAATFQSISITKSQVSDFPTTWALANVTGADDLKAIEALTGTSGFLKKTAANTWVLDTDVASGTALTDVSTRVGTLEGYFSSGIANNAARLSNTTKIGDTNKPVYFTANGVPAAISYTIGRNVAADEDVTAYTAATNGNISVSNHKIGISMTKVDDPTSSGSALSFIDTISQNTAGRISVTKKAMQEASANQSGIVSTGAQTFAGHKTFNAGLTSNDNIVIANAYGLYFYEHVTSGTARTLGAVTVNTDNVMSFGYGAANLGYNTWLCGNQIHFRTGTAANNTLAATIDANKNLAVKGDITTEANVMADGGVSAKGISDLSIGAGGGGTATSVSVNGITYVAQSGIITIPDYPTWGTLSGKPTLATVATSGNYNDLSNKPTIPTKSSWNYDDRYVRYDTSSQGLTSTQKANARTNIGAGTYSKPSGGIPASDLAESYYLASNPNGYISGNQTITLSGDVSGSGATSIAVTIGTGKVTNAMLAGSIAISKISGLQTALDNKLATSLKGAANGLAELDANGLVPSSQLPSYVDDVLEYSSKSAFPATGETGKIYVALDTNLTWRWSGSAYVEISPSLALGETSSTAYRGDRGKIAYDHATDASRLTTAQSSGFYKFATTAEGHIASVTAVAASDLTGLLGTTYMTDISWDSTNNKLAWSKGGTAQTAITIGLASKATQLATARKIWGKSFDGTTAVDGDLCLYGSGGDTGITGTTNADSAKILLYGIDQSEAGITGPHIQAINVGSYGKKRFGVFQHNSNNYTTENTEVFSILPNGNVGIGTTSPAAKLQILGASGEVLRLSATAGYIAGNGPLISFWHTANEQLASISGVLDRDDNGNYGNLVFGTRASDSSGVTTKMLIKHNGNVGIGTTSPSQKLQVAGTIYSSVAQGTAPFKVDSTTAVTNLNADLLDGQHGSYFAVKATSKGSTTKPIYTDANGAFTECSTYAGGTAVTLNNSSKAASTASFYAPTAGGTAGYVLIGKGTTTAPDWTSKIFVDTTNSRVGINTTSPAKTLDVNGTFRAAGDAVFGGSTSTTGVAYHSDSLVLDNDKAIYFKEKVTSGTARTLNAVTLNQSNVMSFGYGAASYGMETWLNGDVIKFRTGTGNANAIAATIDADKNLSVLGDVVADGGMAAKGISDLSVAGGSHGEVTSIQFDPSVAYTTANPYTAQSGLVKLPAYPTNKSAASGGTDTTLVTTGDKYKWNTAYNWGNHASAGYAKAMSSQAASNQSTFSLLVGMSQPSYFILTCSSTSYLTLQLNWPSGTLVPNIIHYLLVKNTTSSVMTVTMPSGGTNKTVYASAKNVKVQPNTTMEFSYVYDGSAVYITSSQELINVN